MVTAILFSMHMGFKEKVTKGKFSYANYILKINIEL